MSEKKKSLIFTVIGGDRRQATVTRKLLSLGHTVRIFGLGELSAHLCGAEIYSNVAKALQGCDILLLPLPVSRDNVNVSFISSTNISSLNIRETINLASKGGCKILLGGMLSDELIRLSEAQGIKAIDYYVSDALQKKNALPSAEGALMIAMEHTDITVKGMKALVCGYGRIGSCLCSILDALGATVCVAARGDRALCEASLCGYDTVRLGDSNGGSLAIAADSSDVIFNTVPSVIFSERVLNEINTKPLYIEIASSPGGIDTSFGREKGLQIIFAPSLPGKYSPKTAGEYIFETISDILLESGVNICRENG